MIARKDLTIFLPSLGRGGAQRVMALLAQELIDRGYRVDVVVATHIGSEPVAVRADVPVVTLGAASTLGSLPRLIKYLKETRPRVLLTAGEHTAIVGLWARRYSGTEGRTVVGLHGVPSHVFRNPSRWRGRLLAPLARVFFPWADGVVAVSSGVAEDLLSWARVIESRIHVIHNPVITDEMTEAAAETPDHPWLSNTGPPVLLAVGRLVPVKDFATLLRAFAKAREQRDLRLIILGDGPEREQLGRLARDLGILDSLSMPGFVANPFAYMARAAMLVLSSRAEAFGNVLVEALACGCRVVSTDCPTGPSEILLHGRYGELVPVGNADALAEAILRSVDGDWDELAARRRAAAFGLRAGVDAYEAVLFNGVSGEVRSHPPEGAPAPVMSPGAPDNDGAETRK